MEPDTGADAKGKDSYDDQNAPDLSSLTGNKADQDKQILMETGDANWYKSSQALKYLQPVFVPIVKDKMKSLQLQSMTDFGRQLCKEATADDIILVKGNLAQFKHLCPGTVVACQNLLNIIKGHTTDSVKFYQMLKGTDPQRWLKSSFEFVRLYLKDWMRCDIHDFQECDITALCTIVKRCKPLMQIFDEQKIDELRKVRNRTMHPATMSITQQEMENNIDVILDFLEHIKSLKNTDEVTEAIESIKQLRTGDVRLLHSMVVRLIQGWLPGVRIAYEHKCDQANNQLQDIIYMENTLARLSSGPEITPINRREGHEFGAKTQRLTDESQKLKLKNEHMAKLKGEKRKLEKQNEELSKRLKEEKRELEKQNEELKKRLQEEKRKLKEENKKLKDRLEISERLSFGGVWRRKEISTQRSPDDALEVKEPSKRTASGGERFPTQALSKSTSSGAEHETVKEEFSMWNPLSYDLNMQSACSRLLGSEPGTVKEELSMWNPLSYDFNMQSACSRLLGSEPGTVKEEFSMWNPLSYDTNMQSACSRRLGSEPETVKEESPKPKFLSHSLGSSLFGLERFGSEPETVKEESPKPKFLSHSLGSSLFGLERFDLGPSPATGYTDVSTIPVTSDKDKGPCYITGMVAISGTQLMLADDSNRCIKLLDLERGTVIGVKELPSAPHDVTRVPGSRVAVTIPYIEQIHVFTADQNLKRCGIMSVDGFCLGIHCSGNRFFVSCKLPPRVQILNMDGFIIKTIKLAPIECPMYLTCSPDNKFTYVSDLHNDTVTCMDMTESVQWVYNCRHCKSAGLISPQGVCTGDGCIYICSIDQIHVVSLTGTKLAIIPFRMTGSKNVAVCYSSQERTLYVSAFSSDAEKNAYISRIRMY